MKLADTRLIINKSWYFFRCVMWHKSLEARGPLLRSATIQLPCCAPCCTAATPCCWRHNTVLDWSSASPHGPAVILSVETSTQLLPQRTYIYNTWGRQNGKGVKKLVLSPFLLRGHRARGCYVTCPVSFEKSVSELGVEMRSGVPFSAWIRGSCFPIH